MKAIFLIILIVLWMGIAKPSVAQTQEQLAIGLSELFAENNNDQADAEKTKNSSRGQSIGYDLGLLEALLLLSSLGVYGWTLYKWKWR